jgi:hypothetical protein
MDCLKEGLTQLANVSFATDTNRNKAGLGVIIRWITVKWMCLLHLLERCEGYSPDEFLYSQMNGRSSYYKDCYNACKSLSLWNQDYQEQCDIWECVHRNVIQAISNKTGIITGFGFAFDEAQVLHELFTDLYVTLYYSNN